MVHLADSVAAPVHETARFGHAHCAAGAAGAVEFGEDGVDAVADFRAELKSRSRPRGQK